MKSKITTLFLAFLFSQNIAAQIGFPENNAIWKESHTTIAGPMEKHFGVCGDTIMDGINYNLVFEYQVDSALNIIGETYRGGLRVDGEKVYHVPDFNPTEYLLFDYGLEAGDSIELSLLYFTGPITRHVDSVKTQMLAGEMRKVIYFRPGYNGAPVEFWIEGIGSSYGLLGRAFDPGADIGFQLLCFQHGSAYFTLSLIECFLPELNNCPGVSNLPEIYKPVFSVYPNPAFENIQVASGGDYLFPVEINLYNMDGRLAKHFPGTYSENISLDISDQNAGVYFLEIINAENKEPVFFEKTIIQ